MFAQKNAAVVSSGAGKAGDGGANLMTSIHPYPKKHKSDKTQVQIAIEYHEQGLATFPLPRGVKYDTIPWGHWRVTPPTPEQIKKLFAEPCNTALLCGAVSSNLVVTDCDGPVSFSEQGALLDGLGITTRVIRRPPNGTPHDGGGAYLFRAPEPVRSAKGPDDIDIVSEGKYVLVPSSEHPGGGEYYDATNYPIFTLPSLTTLAWLDLQPAPVYGDDYRPRISRKAWDLLRNDPEVVGQYRTRSEAQFALCCALVRAGRDLPDAVRLLRNNPGPGKFQEMYAADPGNASRHLALTFDNAKAWVAAHPSEARLQAQTLREQALERPWPGRTGSSDRAVYLAHTQIVIDSCRDVYHASARDLAQLAGIAVPTVTRANHRLADAGLIELIEAGIASCAHRWRLVMCAQRYTPPHGSCMECNDMHTFPQSHDAFRRRGPGGSTGLGKTGHTILTALQRHGPQTVKELAATGPHRTTVKRKLDVMRRLGLVVAMGDGLWRVVDEPDLDEAARLLGTKGAGAAQRQRHVDDRRMHRKGLREGQR